jgi:hypothetical protein
MSHITMDQYILYNLEGKMGRSHSRFYCPKNIAYEELQRATQQDFGYDAKAWRRWQRMEKSHATFIRKAALAASERWAQEKRERREQLRGLCQTMLSAADYEVDLRQSAADASGVQFHRGWQDAVLREKSYTSRTLKRLTWRNLGYRIGKSRGAEIQHAVVTGYYPLRYVYYTFAEIFREIQSSQVGP